MDDSLNTLWNHMLTFQLLKFPEKDQAMEKPLDLTMLSDIFPTGYHGALSAGIKGLPCQARADAEKQFPRGLIK